MVTVPRSALASAIAGIPKVAPLPQLAGGAARRAPQGASMGLSSVGIPEPEVPWWQEALAPVLQGPIGKALQTIDLGRSALVSTVKEGIDLVQGEGFSGSDWLNQVKTHYGFGDILRDENVDLGKWGNRVVGFVGDVALDPITYLTFGSGSLQKMGYKEVADQLMDAGKDAAARRVRASGSKLAAGAKDLRAIGYDVGLSFSMPGTGAIGRTLRLDRVLDGITGGAVSARRAAEWAPAFRTLGAKHGIPDAERLFATAFKDSTRTGRETARKLFDKEASAIALKQQAVRGSWDPTALREATEGISEELLDAYSRATRTRLDLFWRKGNPSTTAPTWTRKVEGLGGEYVTGQMAGRSALRMGRESDSVVLRTATSGMGRMFQAAIRSTLGENLSKHISRTGHVNQFIVSSIDGGDPAKYWAARALETGDHIGFANRGKYAEVMDRLQGEMLNAAHRAGFDIAQVDSGALYKLTGAEASGATQARRRASRILYEASTEPWVYKDGTPNPNLVEFKKFINGADNVTISAEDLHKSLRKFWEEGTTAWEGISKRSIRETLGDAEVYASRSVSEAGKDAASKQGWWRQVEDAPRMGERPPEGGAAPLGGPAGRAVRDVAYTTKERVFVPGFEFTWRMPKAKPQGFTILEPGTAGRVAKHDYTHAPSVQRQIENFLSDVDPRFLDPETTFFETDFARVIDRYKQTQGRELIWAGMEDHLVAKGIFVESADLAAGNRFLQEIADGAASARRSITSRSPGGKRYEAVQESKRAAAARAKHAWEESDATRQKVMDAQGTVPQRAAQAAESIDELDVRVAAIQRTLMNLSDEVQEGIVRGADGKFRTAPQATRAMEDLLEMAVGLEATHRLARMLRTVGESIETQRQAQRVSAHAADYPDLASEVQRLSSVNKAYDDILSQLALTRDMLEIVKNQAHKLGGLDKGVRDVEALIDGLIGQIGVKTGPRAGLARKSAPKYIQDYVEQVHEIGRLADELDAGVTFNAGYRKPLFRKQRMTPEEIAAGRAQIYNRQWVERTRRALQQQLEGDVAAVREGQALADDAGVFSAIDDLFDTPQRTQLLQAEAERLTLQNVVRESQEEVLRLNDEAVKAYEVAARMEGAPQDPLWRGGAKSVREWEATALDLESQRAAREVELVATDVVGAPEGVAFGGRSKFDPKRPPMLEILEQDISKFQDADNIFRGLLAGREGVDPDKVAALVAGFQDGMLPFGPVYGGKSGQMFQSVLGNATDNADFLHLMRSTMNVGQGEVGDLLRVWDSMTGYFKAQAVARPAFVQRNGLGGMFNNLVAGMDLNSSIKFMRLRERAIKKGWKDALKEIGLTPEQVRNEGGVRQFMRVRPGGLKRRAAEIGAARLARQGDGPMRDLNRVYRSGAIGAGQAASEVAQSWRLHGATTVDRYGRPLRWNPLRRDNVWNTAIRSGNSEMEEILRGSLALDSVFEGLDDAAMIARVTKYHFNYSKDAMSDTERQVLSRAMPFYTWTRNSLPLMATELVRNPKPFLRYLTLKRNMELGVEPDRSVPAWYGERWGIDMSALLGNPNQGARAWAFPDLPFMDLVEATSGGPGFLGGLDPSAFASGLAPQIKTPIEMLTGTSLFQQLPIRSEYIKPPVAFDIPGLLPFLSALPGNAVAKNHRGEYRIQESAAYALQNFIPYLAQLRRLVPREERYKAKTTSAWLSWVMPVGYRDPGTVQYESKGAHQSRSRERSEDRGMMLSLETSR